MLPKETRSNVLCSWLTYFGSQRDTILLFMSSARKVNESKLFPINSVSSLFLRHPVYIQFICVQPQSCDSEKFALPPAVLDQLTTEDKSWNLKKRIFCGTEIFEYTRCCTHYLSPQVIENALCAKGELIMVHLMLNFNQQPGR